MPLIPYAPKNEKCATQNAALTVALGFYVCVSIWSLCGALGYGGHHLSLDPQAIAYALMAVVVFSLALALFAFAPFSFGFFLSFYLYNVTFGYLWLSWFTDLDYDRLEARLSAVTSAIAFAIPALFLSIELPACRLSRSNFERLLLMLLALAVGTILWSATYSFRFITFSEMDEARKALAFPRPLAYSLGIFGSSVLPFAFACFVLLGSYWRASFALFLLMLLFPITLNKSAFFSPFWLVALAILSRLVDTRMTVVLSRLLPALGGVVLLAFFGEQARLYFDVVNFRMLTIPSNATNLYYDFFSTHQLTHFCQISFLKLLIGCPYADQLGVVMHNTYGLGNFNASLLATEGIASVGVLFAPFALFVCGLLIAAANAMAKGLPDRFVLLSGALLAQTLTDVPLTTGLLTHGGALLFLLWYLTPRDLFDRSRELRDPSAVRLGD